MILDFTSYNKIFANSEIILVYNGPLWSGGIYSMAEMFRQYLDLDGQPSKASLAIFAVFIEQLNNMMMHSAERVHISHPDGESSKSPKGSFIVATSGESYHLQAGNAVSLENSKTLKKRLDHLNSLSKKEILADYKERLRADSDEASDSKGAGIGLTEIAWRASSKIDYEFTTRDDGSLYFNVYVTV